MKFLAFVCASLAAVLLLSSTAFAADPVHLDIIAVDEQPGHLVATVSALGPDGKPLGGLSSVNFKATLGGTPIVIDDAQTPSVSHVPTSILLLVDVSGSMAGDPMTQAKAAMQEFVKGLDPADKVGVVAFDSKVTPLQDFTTDRNLINQAITKLTPNGDTALYDALIDATSRMSQAQPGRHIVVLLSDGQATSGLDQRGPSLDAVRASGINVVAVGLGPVIDRQYMGELTSGNGGRLLEAPTPASLRQSYADLASAIRGQLVLQINVPSSLNRTQPADLNLSLTVKTDIVSATRALPPLAGASTPPFDLSVTGVKAGQKLKGPATLLPQPARGITLARVDYVVDGTTIQSQTTAPFSYELDAPSLAGGSHILKVQALDAEGRRGEAQIPFISVAAAAPKVESEGSGGGIPWRLILGFVMFAALLGGAFVLLKKRDEFASGGGVSRIEPWAKRVATPSGPVMDWPEQAPAAPTPPPLPPVDYIQGYVVVIDEAAIRAGSLDAQHMVEYEIHSTPLTFGTGDECDIKVKDEEGYIAAEEARIWVQRGRLVYHKLTTLSAMATEGVTSGWQFLDNGEDMRVGPYQLAFRLATAEEAGVVMPEPEPIYNARPQEHGMALRDAWNRAPEDTSPPSIAS